MSVAMLSHVELLCPDLEGSRRHFKNIVGLHEAFRSGDKVYFRAWGEWRKYSLILTESNSKGVDHISLKVEDDEDLESYKRRIESSGYDTWWLEEGKEPGQGRALRFDTPAGQTFELIAHMDRVQREEIPPEMRTKLKNQPQKLIQRGIAPKRIDHATMYVKDVRECLEWFQDVLDFNLREYVVDEQDNPIGVWISVTPLVHDIAFTEHENHLFNHVAYYLKRNADIYRAADILKDEEVMISAGPGQHGISRANYLYHVEPSGNQVELFAGGYLIFDPEWEPIKWTPDDIPEYTHWWGKERVWNPAPTPSHEAEEYETEQ